MCSLIYMRDLGEVREENLEQETNGEKPQALVRVLPLTSSVALEESFGQCFPFCILNVMSLDLS